jgi:hypothetical protein
MVEDFSFGLRWEIYMKPPSKFKGMATPRRERQRSMIYRSRWRCGRRGTKVRMKKVLILDGDVDIREVDRRCKQSVNQITKAMHVLKFCTSLIKPLLSARRKKLIKPAREDFLEAIAIRNILNFF